MQINFTSQADTCARACVIVLGFAIPISVALDNILLALLFASWLASGNFRGKLSLIRSNPVARAALVLFGLLALGLAYGTRDPGDGLRYLGKYLDLLFVPVFLTMFQSNQTRNDALKAFFGAIVLSIIVSHLTHLGLFYNKLLVPHSQEFPGGFKYSITHALLVGFSAFVFALLARHTARRLWRIVFIALAVIAAHNVLFTVISRTGYLVLAALMLYFCIVSFRGRGLAAATAFGIVFIFAGYYGSDRFEQRVNSAVSELAEWQTDKPSTTSIGVRMEFYRGALQIVREHPVFGAGTGSFPAAYAEVVSGKNLNLAVNPHNEYLLITTQIGLIGLACLVYLFYLQWRLAAQLEPLYRDLARGLVLMFVIGCMFNSLLLDHTEGLFFAWATGLLFAGLKPPAHTTEHVA